MLLFLAALYGITMKIADLLNEHGLTWFAYSGTLFGFLWGIFGAFIVLFSSPLIASAVIAMNIAFITRNRLDFLNHQIAASLIIIAGIVSAHIESIPFLVFFFTFLVFGSIKDYADDILKSKNPLFRFNELMPYYPLSTLIYCLFFGNWLLFGIFTVYTVAYNATKEIARRKGYH